MLSQLVDVALDDLKYIIESHSRLTHLSLGFNEFVLSYEAIEMLQTCGKNLIHLRLTGLHNVPTYSTLKALFEDIFPNITFYKYSTGDGEIIMKKRNVSDWYLDFQLMHHF